MKIFTFIWARWGKADGRSPFDYLKPLSHEGNAIIRGFVLLIGRQTLPMIKNIMGALKKGDFLWREG